MFGTDNAWQAFPLREGLLQIEAATLFFILAFLVWAGRNIRVPDLPWFFKWKPSFILLMLPVFFGMSWWFAYEMGYPYILLAFDLAIGIFLSVIHPAFALSFFIGLMFIRPWEIMLPNDVMMALPKGSAFLAIGSMLFHRMRRLDFGVVWNRGCSLLLALAVMVGLSMAIHPNAYSEREFFDGYLKSVLMFYMILNIMEDPEELTLLKGTVLIAAAGGAVAGFYFTYNTPPDPNDASQRLETVGILGNSNDLAAIMVMALPIAWTAAFKKGSRWYTWPLGAFAALLPGLAIWDAQSRGAILAIAAMMAVLLYIKFGVKYRKVAIAVAAIGLAVSLTAGFKRSSVDTAESTSNRLNYWKAGLNMAIRNPITGVGFGNYPSLFEAYAPEIVGEYGKRTAHSSWVLILAETGFIGFGLFAALFVNALKAGWRVREEHPELLLSLVGYMMAISFLSHTYHIYPYILFGLVIAASRMKRGLPGSDIGEARVVL